MMVHSWHTQHLKLKYVEKDTGEEGYLSPQVNDWIHAFLKLVLDKCYLYRPFQISYRKSRLSHDHDASLFHRFICDKHRTVGVQKSVKD